MAAKSGQSVKVLLPVEFAEILPKNYVKTMEEWRRNYEDKTGEQKTTLMLKFSRRNYQNYVKTIRLAWEMPGEILSNSDKRVLKFSIEIAEKITWKPCGSVTHERMAAKSRVLPMHGDQNGELEKPIQ